MRYSGDELHGEFGAEFKKVDELVELPPRPRGNSRSSSTATAGARRSRGRTYTAGVAGCLVRQMNRWWASVAVLLTVSGCGRVIADCFCAPGSLSVPSWQPTTLASVPRGCARTDPLYLSNATGRTFPELSIVSATSTNPAITIDFPTGVVGNLSGVNQLVELRVTTDAPLDGPATLETDVELVTDTGNPKALSFHLSVPLVVPTALPPLDFGGVALGTTATIPYSFLRLTGAEQRLGIAGSSGLGFDYAVTQPAPNFEVRFSPPLNGRLEGAIELDIFAHCPQLQRMPLVGDGVTSVLTAAPATLDFGDVAVGTVATRTIDVENAALAELPLFPFIESEVFQAAFSTTPLAAAHRDAQGALVPGRTTLEVTFSPRAVGTQGQDLGAIADWLGRTWPLRFTVTGVGR